jgi:hypothetical protein
MIVNNVNYNMLHYVKRNDTPTFNNQKVLFRIAGFNKTSEEGARIGNKHDEEVMNPSLFLTRTSTFVSFLTSLRF